MIIVGQMRSLHFALFENTAEKKTVKEHGLTDKVHFF
jgi:hypothetical protein